MTLAEVVKQARRWETFNMRGDDGKWLLVQHLFFDQFFHLNGWGQFGHRFGDLARDLLSSDKWEFAQTETQYLEDKKLMDKLYHVTD